MELARAYFAQALKGNPNNMRALYGLFMVSNTHHDTWGSLKTEAMVSEILHLVLPVFTAASVWGQDNKVC